MSKKWMICLVVALVAIGSVGCTSDASTAAAEAVSVEDAPAAELSEETEVDAASSASVDGTTSASIVPDELISTYEPGGFTDGDREKALFIVGDPRKYSVQYDLVFTAMKHLEAQGMEVEIRDLYAMDFNPVLSLEDFYYAKDGTGEASATIAAEQDLVAAADHLIFSYPNWHDTPTAIVKGYMETVFAKQFAYRDTENGLEGLLADKSFYTIMNAGFLGGGRGYMGDGVGINDEAWDRYMEAFAVMDDDTAGFWGAENRGRFVNDRTPSNGAENYREELEKLRKSLIDHLDRVYF